MRAAAERIQLRDPDPKKKGPCVVADRYAVLRRTALTVVPRSAPGITLDAYLAKMGTRLPKAKGWDPAASTAWCAMAIKLDLEARGELKRVNDKPPQRLVRA
ncbi:MAG TPA: hypothetical protein VIN69_01300 [Candidatus Limnocylindria bacterium]